MCKKAMTMIFVVLMTVSFSGTGLAMEQGNKRKGKYTYRKVYKACHERGAADSLKPTLDPDAKSQAEWETLFDSVVNTKTPEERKAVIEEGVFKEFGCEEEWEKLSDEDLTDIFTYLHAHASDSPTPAKCK